MTRIPVASIRRRIGRFRQRPPSTLPHTACFAPFSNLFLGTTGDVYTCCDSFGYPLGNIADERLPDIWASARLAALRDALGRDDYSLGCGYCERRIAGGLRPQSRFYDAFPPATPVPPYPQRIEFNISNACNLQCTMCDGDLSSAIRIHREHRPALPAVYGEEFFTDIETFIPHLRDASFTGGEPFLGPENERLWEMLARLVPDVKHTVTTNGTQWNARVERVLDSLRTHVNISIDGFTKDTYEAIRPGADRDEVFANIDRFRAHAAGAGTSVYLFHCLMPQNHHELGDLLLWAEARDLRVIVHLVEDPPECCLERLPDDEWQAVRHSMRAQGERVLPQLTLNADAFREQLDRVEHGRLRPLIGESAGLALGDVRR